MPSAPNQPPAVPAPRPGGPSALFRLAALAAAAVWLGLAGAPLQAAEPARPGGSKIAVFAPLLKHYGPESPYAEAMRRIYDRQSWGPRLVHRFFPSGAQADPRAVSQALAALAEEEDIKAVILGSAPLGSLEGCARLRLRRPDMLIIALDPEEDPLRLNQVVSLVLRRNQDARGFLMPLLARRMGAEVLIRFCFPRHHDQPSYQRQFRVMVQAAEDQGVFLIPADACPDPRTAGPGDIEAYVHQTLNFYRETLGKKAAFCATDNEVSEVLINYALKKGGLALDPVYPSLFLALPEALNLAGPAGDLFGQWKRLLTAADERYLRLAPPGQVSTWAYPYPLTAILAAVDLAAASLDRQTDFYDLKNIGEALEKFSPGEKWQVSVVMDYERDVIVPHTVTIMADSYWFGRGYQGFTRLSLPNKYLRLR